MSRRPLFAVAAAALFLVSCSKCSKEPPSPAAGPTPSPSMSIDRYEDIVGGMREAGLPGESTCEREPASASERRSHLEWRAKQKEQDRTSRDAGAATVAELAKTDDVTFVSELKSRIFDKVTLRGSRALSRAERVLWLEDLLEGEVTNGGFHQYFSNSAGDCALPALEALRTIGDPKLLEIYEGALAVFPSSRPASDRRARNEQMSRVPNEFEAWSKYDDAFYAHRALDQSLALYLKKHLTELDLPPSP